MRLGVLVLVVGCASSSGALQAPPPVACPSGVAAWVDGTSYPTVQAALDAASPAGPARVDVCPGTWVENLELPFVGDWTIAGVGPARPALDGGLAGPVLSSEDSALTLVDLVLQNGRNDESGGGLWLAGGSLEALRVDLRDNVAGEGGGAAIYDADVTLSGCRFERNVADWGESGGGGLLVTQLHAGHQATIADTTFVANEAIVGGAGGGARLTAFADAGVAMDRVLFEANVADAGAAMFAQAEDGVLAARLARAVVRRHDNGQTGEGTLYTFASPGAAVSLDVVGGQIADNVARASPALLAIGLPSGSPGE
ncbi:MAG TPA: hypothetical protein PKA64_17750, partial [Myxococcota bacterium]|nr:hypothetical protein [Myxococcota bacterium]